MNQVGFEQRLSASEDGRQAAERPTYRILLFLHARNFDRLFECALLKLLEAGHRVHVAFDFERREPSLFDTLVHDFENLTCGPAPDRTLPNWDRVAKELRLGIDYLRYLEPDYADATELHARAHDRAPRAVTTLTSHMWMRSPGGRRALGNTLRAFERSLPVDPEIERFIATFGPDVVVVSPLVSLGSMQSDYIRAARRLGIRTALLVASWDNLTNKGVVRDVPESTIVWNDVQLREARDLHGIDESRIEVVGAHTYDHWFSWRPSKTREEFCGQLGFDPEKPIVLYVCSSPFISGDREPELVERWLGWLRSADPPLSEANALVRPHPQNPTAWHGADLSRFERVAIWPRGGASPVDDARKADYFDSIYHCSAVVGLNTSALVESAIVGRPVFTILTDDFRATQEGTLHFSHLAGVGDEGVLTVARTFEEHNAQLAAALTDPARYERRLEMFVRRFVRPAGLNEPSAPRVVERLESLAALPTPAPERPSWHVLLRPILAFLVVLAYAVRNRPRRVRDDAPTLSGPADMRVVVAATKRLNVLDELKDAGFEVALAVPKWRREDRSISSARDIKLFIGVQKGRIPRLAARLQDRARGKKRLQRRLLELLASGASVDPRLLRHLRAIAPGTLAVVPPLQVDAERSIVRAARQLGIRVVTVRQKELTPETIQEALRQRRPRGIPAPVRSVLQGILALLVVAGRVRRHVRLRTRIRQLIGRPRSGEAA